MEKRSSRKKGRGKWDNSTQQADSDTSRDSSYTTTSTTAMSTDMANNDRVQVGQIFLVQSIDGRWMPAKILETRQTNRLEYFVHFENHDKRLDEWVGLERIDVTRGELTTNDKATVDQEEIKENLTTRKFTRQQKKKTEMTSNSNNQLMNELDPEAAELEKEREELTKVKYIERIQLGKYEIDTWYFSPYPDVYGKEPKLFICEYCLKYMKNENSYKYHLNHCFARSPPGKEIYHKDSLSVFEVNSLDNKIYCQCLTLLAKLFLDHKTLYFDVSPFVFYVLTEVDKSGCHLVGYFSKEIDSSEGNNLACILTLPPYQRKGYGKFLIAFSYLLTRMEGTCGSPEKPLSDLGKLSYRSYWSYTLLTILKEDASTLTIDDLSKMTGFTKIDIVETLNSLGLIKYWRGENILCVTPKQVEEKLHSIEPKRRPQIELDPSCLVWEPPNSTCDVAPTTSAAASATSSKGGAARGAGKY